MTRPSALFLVFVLLTTILAALPAADATHEYGHRFMIAGRLIDVNGEPAQQTPLRVTVETTNAQDPYMTVATDCFGFFYTFKRAPQEEGPNAPDRGLEAGVMHIHKVEFKTRGTFSIQSLYGNLTDRASAESQHANVVWQVDEEIPKVDSCQEEGFTDFDTRYIVTGRVQEEVGTIRQDIMSFPDRGVINNVTVTLETTDGLVTKEGTTNRFGDYIIEFENVTVESGAKVTASHGGETVTGKASTKYRMTGLDILLDQPGAGDIIRNVFLGIVGAAILIGGGMWAWSNAKSKADLRRARKTSERKRAN